MIRPLRIVYFVDHFPELTETFVSGEVAELRKLGHEVRVESATRAANPDPDAAGGVPVAFLADDPRSERLLALAWLVARHPLRCLRDLRERRRWAREEHVRPLRVLAAAVRRTAAFGPRHLHAHFAAGAALDAMRTAALLGLPYSVMTHGYDIFRSPRNLREKHERAAFAVTACEYSARHLRAQHWDARIHVLVMGVDADALRRTRPHPRERVVVAVARLTEKKGLRHLVEAARLLADRVDRVLIVGDGPLRDELRDPAVELLGARLPAEVKDILQSAAVLAMPCVVAADGDRDTMPVAVKEALALEVPVVASDEVGLPEVVQHGWGRLVAPGDPAGLAGALDELLSLAPEERARMGRAGRAFVEAHCSRAAETARLAELIATGRAP